MKNIKLKPLTLAIIAWAYTTATMQVAMADDTEIYVPKEVPADQQVRPNILMILDTSGSMTSNVSGTSPQKNRMEVLKEVTTNLIDDLKDKNVNIGFMRFHGNDGGAVTQAVQHLTPANAESMKTFINSNSIRASGNTPMLETYYEAYRYLGGLTPYWGKYAPANINGTDLSALKGNQSKNYTGNWVYKSPITHSCQKTHIVYITDGAPTQDTSSNTSVSNLIDGATNPQGALTNTTWTKNNCTSNNGACLPHLAEYMYNQDMGAEAGYPKQFNDPTNRKQNITSHFVGFALNLSLLEKAAEAGGGKYFTSNTASGLTDALQSIIVDITAANTTFVAPSVAVTAYNNFGFRDELYYALFRPDEGTNWLGNVKKYKLKSKNADGQAITPVIVDRDGALAIDSDTGFFKTTATSFWSNILDGDDVGKGGFASTLTPNSRKIYTWYGADKQPSADEASLKTFYNNGSLNSGITASSVSNAMLGVNNNTDRTSALNWIKGLKSDNSARKSIGDVLHNEPRLIAYTTDENIERSESSNSKEEVVIFVGTNEGFIHAIDAKTGNEKFAFIPKELLHTPNKYRVNDKGYNNKAYGIDGYFTALTQYGERLTDDTRKISKANLYAGMRRGGSNYYALNVKDLNSPKIKWVIKGAYKDNYSDFIYSSTTNNNYSNIYRETGNNGEVTPGFEKLGLTFSAAKIGKLTVNGAVKDVLVFTGGYDVQHDEVGNNIPKNDQIGNAIYIVDADTGDLLWRAAGNNDSNANLNIPAMTNSIPASPTLIDINNDGLIDIIYAADLRGQIFRFDIESGNLDNAKGHLFAQLGGTNKENNRRFFNSPDVALIRDRDQSPYFTVSIGSGFRESPLNEQTDDRFYMIRDTYVTQSRSALASPPVITEMDLTDVSGLNKDASETAEAYAKIAQHQSQIDNLEAAVRQKEQDFESHKTDLGYTQLRDEYLNHLDQANIIQRDIDAATLGAYPDFDVNNYTPDKHYNSDFLPQHAMETKAQAEIQTVIVNMQNVIQKLYNAGDTTEAETLSGYYDGLVNLQSSLNQSAKQLIQKENFILRGHAKPDFTNELKDEIESKFPGKIADYSSFGDFSDLAYLLNDEIDTAYTSHKDSTDAKVRETINSKLQDLQAAITAPSINVSDIIDLLNGVTPNASTDIAEVLSTDHALMTAQLNDLSSTFNGVQDAVNSKNDERNNILVLAEAARDAASDIEQNQYNNFQEYIDNIEAAYAATRDTTTGIYALRVKINQEYADLDLAGDQMSESQTEHLLTSQGFLLRLPRGEKVLSDSISYTGSVLFSTFSPRGQTVSECGSDIGIGRTYGLSLRTAEGIFAKEVNGKTEYIRSQTNQQAGIPPTPVIIITEGEPGSGKDPECEGPFCTAAGGDYITPSYWRESK